MMNSRELVQRIDQIVNDPEKSDVRKLADLFGEMTNGFITTCEHEIALAQAKGDEETAIKERIKGNMMGTAREMFAHCYLLVTGERSEVWHEQNEL